MIFVMRVCETEFGEIVFRETCFGEAGFGETFTVFGETEIDESLMGETRFDKAAFGEISLDETYEIQRSGIYSTKLDSAKLRR